MDDLHDVYFKHMMNEGFLIPQMTVEKPLYRYRSNLEYIVDEIKNDHIFLSPLTKLNDPFDSSFAMSLDEVLNEIETFGFYLTQCYFLHSEKWFKSVKSNLSHLSNQKISLKDFSELLADEIQKEGGYYPSNAIANNYFKLSIISPSSRISYGKVACFSESWDSVPMWSYYAENHCGVCFKYDFGILDEKDQSTKNIKKSLQKIWYSQNRPIDKDGTFSPFIKGLQWAHEQEWRLFRTLGPEYVTMPCLTEIYLGINFDYNNIETIIDAVKQSPRKIEIFSLNPKQDSFGFQKLKCYHN